MRWVLGVRGGVFRGWFRVGGRRMCFLGGVGLLGA